MNLQKNNSVSADKSTDTFLGSFFFFFFFKTNFLFQFDLVDSLFCFLIDTHQFTGKIYDIQCLQVTL